MSPQRARIKQLARIFRREKREKKEKTYQKNSPKKGGEKDGNTDNSG